MDKLRAKLGHRLKENVVIRDYVTTAVGGIVDYLIVCETVEELIEAAALARELELPYYVIGQGSNVLFSDIGFPGLVIINRTKKLAFMPEKSQIITESGVLLSRLIMEAASRDLTGLEFLFGLRGTIGGATINNRQANGVSIGGHVKHVTLLMPNNTIEHHPGSWLDFEAFSSRLMRIRAADSGAIMPVLLTVTLQLSRNKKEEILRKIQHFGRQNRQFWPLTEPSIGPVFRDPTPEQSAEAFLQDLEFKKVKIGRARIFIRQPNFILTHQRGLGACRTADIDRLVKLMKDKVIGHYGQLLEEAFEYFGTWDQQESLVEFE